MALSEKEKAVTDSKISVESSDVISHKYSSNGAANSKVAHRNVAIRLEKNVDRTQPKVGFPRPESVMRISYEDEWLQFFGQQPKLHMVKVNVESIRVKALKGELRRCRFRTICWRLFHGLLPPDVSQWEPVLFIQRRAFQQLHQVVSADPDSSRVGDHPLSQDSNSVWNSYFKAEETKRVIVQDVDRTYPEIEYFRGEEVRNLLTQILFCYTSTSLMGYKQGMHEVLAPVLFALHSDLAAFEHAVEEKASPSILHALFDRKYIAADAFTIFSHIMKVIEPWYLVDERTTKLSRGMVHLMNATTRRPSGEATLFQPTATCHGVAFLQHIHHQLLRKYDPQLYSHLQELDISPIMFGLRWIRLLFGHEFPLPDVLYLWDCLFAENRQLSLVPYLFIGMLLQISHLLIQKDFADGLSLLMRYPSTVDPVHLVQVALHLYKPNQYAMPTPHTNIVSEVNLRRPHSFTRESSASLATPTPSDGCNRSTPSIEEKLDQLKCDGGELKQTTLWIQKLRQKNIFTNRSNTETNGFLDMGLERTASIFGTIRGPRQLNMVLQRKLNHGAGNSPNVRMLRNSSIFALSTCADYLRNIISAVRALKAEELDTAKENLVRQVRSAQLEISKAQESLSEMAVPVSEGRIRTAPQTPILNTDSCEISPPTRPKFVARLIPQTESHLNSNSSSLLSLHSRDDSDIKSPASSAAVFNAVVNFGQRQSSNPRQAGEQSYENGYIELQEMKSSKSDGLLP